MSYLPINIVDLSPDKGQAIVMRGQLKLIPYSNEHGGETRLGQRRIARPIATRRPMHVTFKARRNELTLFRNEIHSVLSQASAKYSVKTYERALCADHIHLAVLARTRAGFISFLKVVSGRIAQLITGSKKGRSQTDSFWLCAPYTRIVEWGKALIHLLRYVKQNHLESTGQIPYQPRKRKPKFTSPKK